MSRTILTAAHLMMVFFTGSVLAIDAEALFGQNCAQCHGANLGGSAHGTALKGPAFKKKWASQYWQALVEISSATMPPGEQDRLTAAEHTAVTKFIFASNGLPINSEPVQDEQGQVVGDSWSGAAGVAAMARSRNNFKNKSVNGFRKSLGTHLTHLPVYRLSP